VYGFKPTTKRLPLKGMRHALDSHDAVVATFGPLAVSRETLNLFMKTILDSKPWRIDESLTIKPWTPVQLEAPLKVAIEWHDGVVMPHPPTTRAMRMIAEACKKAGMEVVDWEPLEHAKAWDIVCGLYFPTGIEPILAPIKASGEPLLPMAKYITYEQPNAQERTLKEYWKLCEERDAYREAYSAHWNKTADSDKEVDVIICPTTPGVAPLHDTARYWSYTSQWNLLDYPTAVFPVTFVDQEKDVQVKDHKPMSEQDKYNHKLYTPEAYAGAPVSLSVVGRRNMDEKVMASLAAIEQAMGRK
jgi:amidase